MASKPELIIVRVMGGLGNQMFQYALGRHLAMLHNRQLKLDLSTYTVKNRNASWAIRNFGLDNFCIQKEIATEQEIAPFTKYIQTSFGSRLLRRLRRWFPYRSGSYILEPLGRHFVFDPELLTSNLSPVVYLDGFWQTEKYFKTIEQIIRTDFAFANPAAEENLQLINQIGQENSVALHIRHGDNAKQDPTHGVLPIEYYQRSIKDLSSKVGSLHIYVFSDDPKWAKENLHTSFPLTFVTQNGEGKDYEDLRLMMACKHHIIGNSTFSWWGAWLGKKTGQYVYAPNRYNMMAEVSTGDLYPQDWTIININ